MGTQLPVLVTSLVLSAFFSGIEIAFVSANPLHFELKSKKGDLAGRLLSGFFEKPSGFISTTLVGNTLALVVYGIVMANILEPVFTAWLPEVINNTGVVLTLQTLVSTIIVLITAEFTPKSVFMINPDRMLTFLAVPFVMIYWILFPLVFIVSGVSRFLITNILKLEYNEEKPVFGLTDLNEYIKTTLIGKGDDDVADVNTLILNNALDFKTVKVRDCLVPRTEIKAVEVNDDIEILREAFISTGHSKIIIYKESIDDVVGYVHSLELFKKPKNITSILTPIPIVPETMRANEVMLQLLNERKSVALVVDEFGGTSGIVSIEDIIEEIFGEIRDEHDDEELIEQKLDDQNYVFSARHEIDYLNQRYNLKLPEGEYDTLGGYILTINENLPSKNQVIVDGPYDFKVLSMVNNRIVQVKLSVKKDVG